METNQNMNDEQTIDLGELFRELLNKALIIILAAIIGGLAGMFISTSGTPADMTVTTGVPAPTTEASSNICFCT